MNVTNVAEKKTRGVSTNLMDGDLLTQKPTSALNVEKKKLLPAQIWI